MAYRELTADELTQYDLPGQKIESDGQTYRALDQSEADAMGLNDPGGRIQHPGSI